MGVTLDVLEARLEALNQRGEEAAEKVDLLIEVAAALRTNEPRRILALAQEAYALADRLEYRGGMAYGLGYMGFAYYLLSDHETAHAMFKRAIALFEEGDDSDGLALTWSGLAGVQMSLGDYDQSLASGIKALKLFQQTGNRLEEAWTLNGFGAGFAEFGAYERALLFYQDALALFEDVGERLGAARALTGIGTVYHREGDYEQALPYHQKSLKIFEETGNRIGVARALNDLGIVYRHLGDLDQALRYHLESLKIREEVENRQAQSTSMIHLSELYLQQDEVEKALEALHQALAIAEDIKAKPRIYQAHEGLANAYERRGDMAEALKHHKAFQRVHEAVQGEERRAAINNLNTRFEVEKAEQAAEIERLRNVELKEKNEQLAQLLADLKAAQTQLVQAEKLASLGQLTAGIAHEIKNPLNFVNNFAQLSVELADELIEELTAHREQRVADVLGDVQDLLDDLKFNAEKIRTHGQRADGIVLSMLEHSRSSAGEHRPTDVNALLDEYVNLAYHGMRATFPGFNATIERDYDEALGEVEMGAREMGRVFLNLLNNAFYAVHERAAAEQGYEPTVQVSTRRTGDTVAVRIADNGPGIDKDFLAKIFEPFFTTKPAGSGTGLGLSISYDIVTQGHGGTLAVESEAGKGATFVITLPA